jgi:hypothetical protein
MAYLGDRRKRDTEHQVARTISGPSATVDQEIDGTGYFAVTKHTTRSAAGWRSNYAVQQPR